MKSVAFKTHGKKGFIISSNPEVKKYLQNQEEIHREKSFIEEFKEILIANEVDFNEGDIFKAVL